MGVFVGDEIDGGEDGVGVFGEIGEVVDGCGYDVEMIGERCE